MDVVAQRTRRWREFYESPSPARHLFIVHCPWDGEPAPPHWPQYRQQRIDWICREYEKQMARAQWLDDDLVPHLNLITGTEIFAEAFGCSVARPADNMPFAQPLVSDAVAAEKLTVPDVFDSTLARQFEVADAVLRRTGPAVTRLPDIQSPMDITALIWDKNTLYIALLESPDAVKALASRVGRLLTAFLEAWFARYGKAFVAHWPEYYMPFGLTLSEDEVGAVSADAFDEFFMPELARLAEHFGAIGVHCCANARHQWDRFRRIPNLRLLNLVQPVEVLRDSFAHFADCCAQMPSWPQDETAERLPEQVPDAARMVFQVTSRDRDDALRLVEKMSRLCARNTPNDRSASTT